jgi:hypothetical protein
VIENGVMNITAVKDGIHANDYITLDGKNINITVNAQGDGIESEGYLTVDKATLNLSGGGKGLNAADYITLTSGTFDSYGYAEGGTISGGTSATLGQSSPGGGQPGGPGGNQPGGPGGRW